ncbi:hypothetical protein HanRHA438_Chr09g0395011 [Helianthus annuus]|nr:hypothetical protein HanHA300_Chr09g0314681 [Helianthus annuus]KAJ0542050.1 hypothetical protein HanHA89_Chr09g0335561 [Helianthus annuus]KAJ0707114.1 hypothetical protein HanLR1_Chr09g0314901 [Helianthus annuus]KAJ0711135.1 hypothetical protein HanOQP8_Chr09g0320481 [Helianthus annuus]KAJ0887799.1 hypothetical protein HanRHA438_Chr09g0395011 [Helianthus annuus]
MLWLEDYLIWVLQYCDDATLRHYIFLFVNASACLQLSYPCHNFFCRHGNIIQGSTSLLSCFWKIL